MNFSNHTNTLSFKTNHNSNNRTSNITGITLSHSTANDNSRHSYHPKPAKISRQTPSILSDANGNGNRSANSGATPARPAVAAQAQAGSVANGVNPRFNTIPAQNTFPAQNVSTFNHVCIINPDQVVNQIPDNPLPAINVYEQPRYYKISRPFRLSPSSASIHHLVPIGRHLEHPLLAHIKGKKNKGSPLYFGVDPTSNTNFIVSDRK